MEIRDEEFEARIKGLLKGSADGGHCPDEERLGAFLDGGLKGDDGRRVSMHLAECERCRESVSIAMGTVPDRVRVPASAVRKVVELVPIKESPWEIVVRFLSDAIEVIKNSGDRTQYFAPAYATSRGPGLAPGSLVAFSRQFAGLDAEVEIERVGAGVSEIKVSAKEAQSGAPAKGVRVNLHRNGVELMSYVMSHGAAIFDKIEFGNYTIDFTRRGIRLGEIVLEIKGE